jgi:hypothetical protein
MDVYEEPGDNPDWHEAPVQNPPGWRPTWKPRKQKKGRKARTPSYPAQQSYQVQDQYQQPVQQAPQFYAQDERYQEPYQEQAMRYPETYMTEVADDTGYDTTGQEIDVAPSAADIRRQYPYTDQIRRAADRAITRPTPDYLDRWKDRAVIRSAPDITEQALQQASVPLQTMYYPTASRDRIERSEMVAKERLARFREVVSRNRYV